MAKKSETVAREANLFPCRQVSGRIHARQRVTRRREHPSRAKIGGLKGFVNVIDTHEHKSDFKEW
jgi:hypothetical protein